MAPKASVAQPAAHAGVHETPTQPNDTMKKPLNTNPFKRPFSHNPLRQFEAKAAVEHKAQQAKAVPVQDIVQKIEQLEEWQIEKLLDMLNNFSSQKTQPANKEKDMDFAFLSPGKDQKNTPVARVQNSNK